MAHADELAAYGALADALDAHEHHATQIAEFAPRTGLMARIGQRPDDPHRRQAWRQAARAVARYRER